MTASVPTAGGHISGRGWLLLGVMAVIWGMPYLFIAQAVDTFSPPAVVAARTLGGALLLLPIAIRAKALAPAWRHLGWVLLFGAIEMAGPFVLLGHAEQTIPSGLAGLLVATVPLFATLIGVFGGDRSAIRPLRLVGLGLGFVGVAIVVGGPGLVLGSPGGFLAVGEVLLVAVCYAVAPFIVARKLRDVPGIGTATLSLAGVGLFYLPIALLVPSTAAPTFSSVAALVLLAVICTALAFTLFFRLIGEVGPVRAPLITYGNTVVAIILGVIVLGEPLTPGLLIGFPIVLAGCWLAATGGRLRAPVEGGDGDGDGVQDAAAAVDGSAVDAAAVEATAVGASVAADAPAAKARAGDGTAVEASVAAEATDVSGGSRRGRSTRR